MTYQDSNIDFLPLPTSRRFVNLIGQTFHYLTPLGIIRRGYLNRPIWRCSCICGGFSETTSDQLLSGKTKSCGCLRHMSYRKTHGLSGTSTYNIWLAMRSRCYKPKNDAYIWYGGRGIKVCERWLNFENFLKDIGKRPSKKHSIERRDNNGDYCPENCYWATNEEQSNNKRSTHLLTFNGKTQSMKLWCDELHLNYGTIRCRINRGKWSTIKALTTPVALR